MGTSNEHKIMDGSSENAPYSIQPSPKHGLGMFATQDTAKGTLLLSEKPLFSLPLNDPLTSSSVATPLHKLPQKQQDLFNELAGLESEPAIVGRFKVNSFHLKHEYAIFPTISRINHSCAPNAFYAWNEQLNSPRLTVYAIAAIEKDKEITVSYIDPSSNLEVRQKNLALYGFVCDCSVCKPATD